MRTSKRIEESCKVCKKWQSHFYWNHMEPTSLKFFVKMKASFKRYLNLPRKFAGNFKGKLSKTVKLKNPGGKIWQIEALKSDNTLCLRSGWKNFVTANKIVENDRLLFKYSGSSSFDVLVFDRSGHEKASLPIIKKEESDSESEAETETGTKPESESDSESEIEKTSSDSDTSIRIFIPPKKIKYDSETSSYIHPGNKRGSNGDQLRSIHTSKRMKQTLHSKPYHVPKRLELSVKQQRIADMLASSTQPGSKLFLKILRTSDFRYYLTIPTRFATENFVEGNSIITLQDANKSKVFSAYCRCTKDRKMMGGGWKKFAHEKNLKEGDLCLFEVKNSDSASQLAVVVHVLPRPN